MHITEYHGQFSDAKPVLNCGAHFYFLQFAARCRLLASVTLQCTVIFESSVSSYKETAWQRWW